MRQMQKFDQKHDTLPVYQRSLRKSALSCLNTSLDRGTRTKDRVQQLVPNLVSRHPLGRQT